MTTESSFQKTQGAQRAQKVYNARLKHEQLQKDLKLESEKYKTINSWVDHSIDEFALLSTEDAELWFKEQVVTDMKDLTIASSKNLDSVLEAYTTDKNQEQQLRPVPVKAVSFIKVAMYESFPPSFSGKLVIDKRLLHTSTQDSKDLACKDSKDSKDLKSIKDSKSFKINELALAAVTSSTNVVETNNGVVTDDDIKYVCDKESYVVCNFLINREIYDKLPTMFGKFQIIY